MQSFESLTRQGKTRRLRALAIKALEQYEFEAADVRLVGAYTNTLFRVCTASILDHGMVIQHRIAVNG